MAEGDVEASAGEPLPEDKHAAAIAFARLKKRYQEQEKALKGLKKEVEAASQNLLDKMDQDGTTTEVVPEEEGRASIEEVGVRYRIPTPEEVRLLMGEEKAMPYIVTTVSANFRTEAPPEFAHELCPKERGTRTVKWYPIRKKDEDGSV